MLDVASSSPVGEGPQEAAPDIARYRPQFHGRAGEYFGIWIVNVLLSIVTLGIYSAWAKVRTERYFYGNTRLAGTAFEYLADPVRILKGRLIAYAAVIALALSYQFMPVLYVLLFLVLFACTPLIVFLGLRFRARYSAWRGLRFHFGHTAGQAYGPFMGWAILSGLTATLLYPLMKRRQHEYVASGHRFGGAQFRFDARDGQYYGPYGIVLALGICGFIALIVATGAIGAIGAG